MSQSDSVTKDLWVACVVVQYCLPITVVPQKRNWDMSYRKLQSVQNHCDFR